jgi:hypothetical protein
MYETTKEWEQYQAGLDYQSKISLLPTADKNERFYSSRQWEGLKTNKLSLIILNVIKRIVDFKISMIMSDMVTMQYSVDGVSDDTQDQSEIDLRQMAKNLSAYSKTAWENLKLDTMNEDGLLDAAQAGDMVSFWYWEEKINDMNGEKVDSVNYLPGDPNTEEINNAYGPVQPYTILAFRSQVADVRREAKENGVSDEDLLLIAADSDTQNQFGDRAKTELEPDKDGGKCIVLLKLWPQDGTIWAKKSTRAVVVRKDWDTELHRYPVAKMCWGKRKNSAYGEADITSMIDNQIEINRTASMIARWVRLHGFPKVIYDKNAVGSWTNDMSVAIGVNYTNGSVANVAQYMQPAQISAAVMQFMEWFIQVTKEMAGANEAVLGEANPTNTSAIIVLQKATAVPLNSVKRRFYRYIEDIGLIWLDFWLTKYAPYGERNLTIKQDNITRVVPMDFSKLQTAKLKLKIDVGPSTQWNEAAAVTTLDNLLERQLISFVEYLKRLPNGLIPDKQGLIDARPEDDTDMQLLYELVAKYASELPPEIQQALQGLNVQQAKDEVKKMVMKGQISPPAQSQPNQRPYANNVGGNQNGMQPV